MRAAEQAPRACPFFWYLCGIARHSFHTGTPPLAQCTAVLLRVIFADTPTLPNPLGPLCPPLYAGIYLIPRRPARPPFASLLLADRLRSPQVGPKNPARARCTALCGCRAPPRLYSRADASSRAACRHNLGTLPPFRRRGGQALRFPPRVAPPHCAHRPPPGLGQACICTYNSLMPDV
jgi:hypothetical protein